jgi:hypothetical protein
MIYKDFFEASSMANLQAKYPDNKADQRYFGGFAFRDEAPPLDTLEGYRGTRVRYDMKGRRYYLQGYVNGQENWIPFDE